MHSSLSLFPERHTKSFGERPVIPPQAYSILKKKFISYS